jgi:hypothetical protein
MHFDRVKITFKILQNLITIKNTVFIGLKLSSKKVQVFWASCGSFGCKGPIVGLQEP